MKVELIGWGIYRGNGKIWSWEDYPDDKEHDGYGILVCGSEVKEIIRNVRDEQNNVVEVEVRDW